MKRKVLALLMVLSLSMAALSGCGNTADNRNDQANQGQSQESGSDQSGGETGSVNSLGTSEADTSEFVKLYGYLLGAPESNFDKVMEEMNRMLKEDINAEMEISFIDWGVLDSKYPLLLAAGEDIDWIYTADWCKYTTEAAKNAFLEIDLDMIEKCMPLYSQLISDAAWDQVAINGKVYMIPTATPDVKAGGWILRKDLADKYSVDLSKVKTLWDVDEYFAALKENEPSMIPMNMDNSYDLLGPIWGLASTKDATLIDAYKCGVVGVADGTEIPDGIYSIFDEPVYTYLKEAAYKMKEWYDKGYINKDVLAATTRSTDNFEQGISGVSMDNTLGMQTTLAKAQEMGWETFILLGNNLSGHQLKNLYTNNGFALAATTKNPERTLMAMDLIMNDLRYNTLLQYGIEGENYVLTEDGKVSYPEGVTADTTTYNWESTGFWFINKDIQYPRDSWTDDYIKLNSETLSGVLIDSPMAAFTFSTDSVKTQYTNVQNVFMQYFYPISIGNVSDVDTAFEQLKVQLEAAGYNEMIAEAKAQFEAYASGLN